MVDTMILTREALDEKVNRAELQLFKGAAPVTAADIEEDDDTTGVKVCIARRGWGRY